MTGSYLKKHHKQRGIHDRCRLRRISGTYWRRCAAAVLVFPGRAVGASAIATRPPKDASFFFRELSASVRDAM